MIKPLDLAIAGAGQTPLIRALRLFLLILPLIGSKWPHCSLAKTSLAIYPSLRLSSLKMLQVLAVSGQRSGSTLVSKKPTIFRALLSLATSL